MRRASPARRAFGWLVLAAALGAAAFWWLTRPDALPSDAMAGITGEAGRGERVFWAGGCAGCHAAPDAEGEARLVLAGGRRFATDFGTFVAPNISSHPEAGIGGWSALDLANAMRRGHAPEGTHYYPAFPYTSYARLPLQGIADLHAYLQTLPESGKPSAPHEVGPPFSIRRGLGLWKRVNLRPGWVVTGEMNDQQRRGRALAEGAGHCGECHTPRGPFGGLRLDAWLAGAPLADSDGSAPNITPAALDWSESDIAYYLETGFTPDFDSAGGAMVEVIENISELSGADRAAIAAYLKAVPAVK